MTLAPRQGADGHRRPSIQAATELLLPARKRASSDNAHNSPQASSSTSHTHPNHHPGQPLPRYPLALHPTALLPPLSALAARTTDPQPASPHHQLQQAHSHTTQAHAQPQPHTQPQSRSLAPPFTLAPSIAPQHQARTKSVSTASPPKLQRPPLGSRANSAPHVPKQLPSLPPHGGAKNGHVARARHGPSDARDDSDSSDDDDDDDADAISRDPFFLRYHSVIQRVADVGPVDDDDPLRKSPPDQKSPRVPMDAQARISPSFSPASADRRALQPAEDINIGVIGDNGVGKTRFIDRAFDLRSRAAGRTATRKMSIDGTVYTVRLLEIPFEELDIEHDDRICWPEKIDDSPAPRIDGALMLYDVMNQESLAQVPGMLSQFFLPLHSTRCAAVQQLGAGSAPRACIPHADRSPTVLSGVPADVFLPLHRCGSKDGVAVRVGRLQVRQPPSPSPGGSGCGGAARKDSGGRSARVSELRRFSREPAYLSFRHAAGHLGLATG